MGPPRGSPIPMQGECGCNEVAVWWKALPCGWACSTMLMLIQASCLNHSFPGIANCFKAKPSCQVNKKGGGLMGIVQDRKLDDPRCSLCQGNCNSQNYSNQGGFLSQCAQSIADPNDRIKPNHGAAAWNIQLRSTWAQAASSSSTLRYTSSYMSWLRARYGKVQCKWLWLPKGLLLYRCCSWEVAGLSRRKRKKLW